MSEENKMPIDPLGMLNAMINNGLHERAEKKIKEWGLQIKIENGQLVDTSNTTDAWLRRFITVNPVMCALKDDVRKLAKIKDEVLIVGPTGTGKEILARALHGDREGRFIACNCAGIPETLLESTLFGHVRGAFTDAKEAKHGLMRLAENGTIFLDEIGELQLELQAKLLRVIQEKVITKVGGDKEEPISCRIVAATNIDIAAHTMIGQFRKDLYARISTFELKTLSLGERQEDIFPILESLEGGKELAEHYKKQIKGFPVSLLQFNVRSLQQIVKRYTVLGKIP